MKIDWNQPVRVKGLPTVRVEVLYISTTQVSVMLFFSDGHITVVVDRETGHSKSGAFTVENTLEKAVVSCTFCLIRSKKHPQRSPKVVPEKTAIAQQNYVDIVGRTFVTIKEGDK